MAREMTTGKPKGSARPLKRTKLGVVDSISGAMTVRVLVNDLVKHRLYGKYMKRRTKLLVHDVKEEARVGDTVEVASCRPHSKTKSWRLVRVVRRGGEVATGDPAGNET